MDMESLFDLLAYAVRQYGFDRHYKVVLDDEESGPSIDVYEGKSMIAYVWRNKDKPMHRTLR